MSIGPLTSMGDDIIISRGASHTFGNIRLSVHMYVVFVVLRLSHVYFLVFGVFLLRA